MPGTNALNVVSEITNVVIDRSFLLETSPALTTIPVTVSYRLHRYDNWNAANVTDDVPVTLNNTVLKRNSDGAVQPSAITNGNFMEPGMDSFAGAGPKAPSTRIGMRTILVNPNLILPPDMYRAESQIRHTDDVPPTPVTFFGNVFPSAAAGHTISICFLVSFSHEATSLGIPSL